MPGFVMHGDESGVGVCDMHDKLSAFDYRYARCELVL